MFSKRLTFARQLEARAGPTSTGQRRSMQGCRLPDTPYHVIPTSQEVPVLATEVPTETTKCSPPATANEYQCFTQIVKRAMIGVMRCPTRFMSVVLELPKVLSLTDIDPVFKKIYYSPDILIFHFIILLSNHLFSNHRILKIFGSISRIGVLRAGDWIYPTSTVNQHTLAARLARFVIPSIYLCHPPPKPIIMKPPRS